MASVEIDLVYLLLSCLILAHFSYAIEIPDERYVKYKLAEDKISHEKLVGKLEKMARSKNMMPNEIVNLLKSARDKDKPGVILDEFSVNNLLELNDFKLGKCAAEVLAEREAICDRLKRRHEPLFEYCAKMNSELTFWCIAKMDDMHRDALRSRGFTKRMEDQVLDLKRRIKKDSVIRDDIASSRFLGNLERADIEAAIRRLLKKRGQKYEAKLVATCSTMVRIMCEYLNVPQDIDHHKDTPINFNINTLMLPFQLCLIAINLDGPSERVAFGPELKSSS